MHWFCIQLSTLCNTNIRSVAKFSDFVGNLHLHLLAFQAILSYFCDIFEDPFMKLFIFRSELSICGRKGVVAVLNFCTSLRTIIYFFVFTYFTLKRFSFAEPFHYDNTNLQSLLSSRVEAKSLLVGWH